MSYELSHLRSAWEPYTHLQEMARHEIEIFELLERVVLPGSRVLEIGIGDGRAVRMIAAAQPSARFFGVDITDAVRLAPCPSACADARQLPFPDHTFDVVFSLGVVEHFSQTAIAVREHARVARPGGYVVITTPRLSAVTLQRWYRYVRNRGYRVGSFETVLGRNLRETEISRHLRAAGLDVIRVASCGSVESNQQLVRRAKTVLPGGLWHPYLYGFGRKPESKAQL